MYCPKCGNENPDDGKFCRKCGKSLAGVLADESEADSDWEVWIEENIGPIFEGKHASSRFKKRDSWESAMSRLFLGTALMAIAGVLAFQPMGESWWFWLMIPAFLLMGSGVAKIIKIEKRSEFDDDDDDFPEQQRNVLGPQERPALPPDQTVFASDFVDSQPDAVKTAPPSVVENTTRLLELEPDGETDEPFKD